LSWQNDYIGFGKLHHRLSLSVTGKTDSHANRLLGSNAETNERQTGGQARLEYNLVNDWHGVYVQLFGQGARETLRSAEAPRIFRILRCGRRIPAPPLTYCMNPGLGRGDSRSRRRCISATKHFR
jgi:hypothetical protein